MMAVEILSPDIISPGVTQDSSLNSVLGTCEIAYTCEAYLPLQDKVTIFSSFRRSVQVDRVDFAVVLEENVRQNHSGPMKQRQTPTISFVTGVLTPSFPGTASD